jgi:hypothetical protein
MISIRDATRNAAQLRTAIHVGAELRAARANWKESLLGKLGRLNKAFLLVG